MRFFGLEKTTFSARGGAGCSVTGLGKIPKFYHFFYSFPNLQLFSWRVLDDQCRGPNVKEKYHLDG